MLHETFAKRFVELEAEFERIPYEGHDRASAAHVADGFWRKWATSAQSLIAAAFGATSLHVRNFDSLYAACRGTRYDVRSLLAVFRSAKEDFEGGYVFKVELRVSGEVFGDFIALARQSLGEGHKDVAAVLACAALEDVLKRYAAISGLDVTDKGMTEIINSLKSAGLVAGPQKSLLEAMPRLRNAALHANWTQITEPEVASVIAFVEQFLLSKFA